MGRGTRISLLHLCMYRTTVPTGPNLTPKRTPKADPGFAFGPLRVRFSKICVRFGSARGSLWVRFGSARGSLCVRSWGVRFAHSCVKWTPLCCYRLQTLPLVYSKYTVQLVHSVVAIGSINTCRTVKRFHGEHQQNQLNFALYSAKNCYSERTCSFTEV